MQEVVFINNFCYYAYRYCIYYYDGYLHHNGWPFLGVSLFIYARMDDSLEDLLYDGFLCHYYGNSIC